MKEDECGDGKGANVDEKGRRDLEIVDPVAT